jgi:hypothetical protein
MVAVVLVGSTGITWSKAGRSRYNMVRHFGNQQKRDVRTGIQAIDNGLTYDE